MYNIKSFKYIKFSISILTVSMTKLKVKVYFCNFITLTKFIINNHNIKLTLL